MYKHRLAAKVDENQREIVKALRKIPGVTVEVGHDDILVGYKGLTYWFEIKRSDQVKQNGEFKIGTIKPSQQKLLETWRGHYQIVWSVEQILIAIGMAEKRIPDDTCAE